MDNPAVSEPKSKKKRKNKKKTTTTANTASTPVAETSSIPSVETELQEQDDDASEHSEPEHEDSEAPPPSTSAATSVDEETVSALTNGASNLSMESSTSSNTTHSISSDMAAATARFDALVRDRDALRLEVTRLRQSLEEVTSRHEREMGDIQTQLQEEQSEREVAEENYQNLLGKVNTIRSQLGERMKADAEDLAQARTRIDELEEQKADLQENYTNKQQEVEELAGRNANMQKELEELRTRTATSQTNWQKEREEMLESETYLREEFEQAKQAMHDWEVLAMEERSIRRDLSDRVTDLEDQLSSVQKDYERAASERDTQSNTVESLQRAMQEIQTARKKELRELVEASQQENQELRKQWEAAKEDLKNAHESLEKTQQDLERALPFEKEVKEKNLLIGKLRHEAVILNDHLTKALRFLKKGKPEDNVDRQIVTNHLLHFLTLDRSDPKKFQILQLIAALLGWTDAQREQAGLQKSGSGGASTSLTGSLRLPGTPMMHKTPSSPALSRLENDYMDSGSANSPGGKESLAELWQSFLEQESVVGGKSRTASTSTAAGLGMMSPTSQSQQGQGQGPGKS